MANQVKKLILLFLFFSLLAGVSLAIFLKVKAAPEKTSQKVASTTGKPAVSKEIKIPEVSLATIFSDKPADLKNFDQAKLVTLIATGDVIPARGANWPAVKSGNFNYNWEKTASYLKTSDISLINLEAPLLKNCPLASSGFTFCGSARQVEGMVFAGIDVANLANNHIGNYGSSGITETKQILEKNNIGWSGFSHLDIKETKGLKFGFLGYNGIGVKINREAMSNEIREARTKTDILIISVHWGKEYEVLPMADGSIAPDNPIDIGHLMIDSGADLIIGNHPHWVQGVEIYKNKFIAYAHGNFIFDQTWSTETQEGVVGEYIFYEKKLISVLFKPIVVDKSYQPVFVEGERAKSILTRMQTASNQFIP